MNILCVTDKEGRIQYNRLHILQKLFQDIQLSICTVKEKIDCGKYDAVYFSHFSLRDKFSSTKDKKTLTSVTSHKCLQDKKKTIKILRTFDRVSVNNTILFEEFKKYIDNLYYTPNGVDTSTFLYQEKFLGDPIVFGWCGNRDREIKNFNTIFKPLKNIVSGSFCSVAPSKSTPSKDILSIHKMVKFYHQLNWFLVTSSAEGTPNVLLESLSCGVPVITTRVGNAIEIIKDGENGWFVDDNIDSFVKKIKDVQIMDNKNYQQFRINARKSIKPWDWKIKSQAWHQFFSL